jgi:ApaG protein
MAKPQIMVSVVVTPIAERTDPGRGEYAYAYTVVIRNTGDIAAQLIARHWLITDQNGHVQEVRGLGVVGHQPLLQPGETFEYTSWTQLATQQGSMRGSFRCYTQDAEPFDAEVPEFLLGNTSALH